MATSYQERTIRVTITLDAGGGTAEKIVFADSAISATIRKQGVPELPTASVEIYGLTIDQMAQLTMLSFDAQSLRQNVIVIEAGAVGEQLSTVFRGEITNSAPDFSSAPSPVMRIEAITTAYARLDPTPPVSVKGAQSASSLCASFASQAGLTFVDKGCKASVKDCVINGDPIAKMQWVAHTVGADLIIDDDTAILLPTDGARSTQSVALISPQTGAIGYPSFDQQGIRFTCFFAPQIHLADLVRIESILPRATGIWKVYSLTHELSARLPSGGAWRTSGAGTWISN